MAQLQSNLLMMNSMNDPSKPKWNEDTPVTDFLYKYTTWSMARYWDDPMRVMQLPSSVPPKYHDKVQALIFDRGANTYLPWTEARKRFIAELAMDGETSKALLTRLEAKYTGAWIRMNEDETIRDYELRYTDLVTRINSLIKDLNGDEPDHPDTIFYKQINLSAPGSSSSTSSSGPTALHFGPETPKKVLRQVMSIASTPQTTTSAQKAADTRMVNLISDFHKASESQAYKDMAIKYEAWAAKKRPELQPAEMRRMFLANLNERYKKDTNLYFSERPNASINDIVKWAIRLESHSSPAKTRTPQVRFAPQDESSRLVEALTRRMDEQDAAHKAELKRMREEQRALIKSKLNTAPITAAHGPVHPDRQDQINHGSNQGQTNNSGNNQYQQNLGQSHQGQTSNNGNNQYQQNFNQGNQGQASNNGSNNQYQQNFSQNKQMWKNCLLCGQQGHDGYSCTNVCIQCGLNHTVSSCQLSYDDLSCTRCGKTGHLAKACINSMRNNGPQGRGLSSRGRGGSGGRGGKRKHSGTKAKCFLWADGDCRFGKRCRFSHLEGDKKNKPQNTQTQQRAPNQATPTPQNPQIQAQPQYPIQPIFTAPPSYQPAPPMPPMPFYYPPPPPMPPHMLQQPTPRPPPIPQAPPQSAMQAHSVKLTREQLLDKAVKEYMANNMNASEQEATNSVISQVAEMTYKNLQTEQ